MAETLSQSRQYFVGVGGEQSGPFSESELAAKIKNAEFPPEALIWYEGLANWQPIDSIDLSNVAAPGPEIPSPIAEPTSGMHSLPPAEVRPKTFSKSSNASRGFLPERVSTFADRSKPAQPVFRNDEAIFTRSPILRHRKEILLLMLGGILYGAYALYNWWSQVPTLNNTPTSQSTKKLPPPLSRESQYRKALSEFALNPQNTLATLTRLIKENPNDNVAKDALKSAVDYYKQTHRGADAGRLLMAMNRPQEAVKFFSDEPGLIREFEGALFAAYQQLKGKEEGAAYLMDDIRSLLGPINNVSLAVERLKIFEKDFPKKSHPFGYYLKSPPQKIVDLFGRLSFHFVKSLLAFMESEFPQINLVGRPLIELKKDKQDRYRLVGTYNGPITLNTDRLEKIHFTFWLIKEQWLIVDTNLTAERKKWAAAERERRKGDSLNAPEMLQFLEQTFRTQFPNSGVHETVTTKPAIPHNNGNY